MTQSWPQVRVENVEANGADPMHVGSQLQVKARVNLGSLAPDDVQVQLFHGVLDSLGERFHYRLRLLPEGGAQVEKYVTPEDMAKMINIGNRLASVLSSARRRDKVDCKSKTCKKENLVMLP